VARTGALVLTMPLTMRPTGLGHGVYKDDIDFGVFSGEWCIGRIYETRKALTVGPSSDDAFQVVRPPAHASSCF
jgi:hypothetical protein